jgi:threonyl-tRNA synthetase
VPDLRITLDREPLVVPADTPIGRILAGTARPGVAVRANEEVLHDLDWVPSDGDRIETLPLATPEGRHVLRHSAAHVLAQAVTDLYPGVKLAIGPPVENGFYYDFGVATPFTPEDLERIEQRMLEIIADDQRFVRRALSLEQAEELFADQPYKLEIIRRAVSGAADPDEQGDAAGADITVYDNVVRDRTVWTDLCRGPHLPSTADIPAVRLLRVAGAYWRGDEANPMLQRIYGTAWESAEALTDYLHQLEEAEKRDHRRLGAELDLFSFPDEVGSGLPLFHPKGGVIRRVLEDYSRVRHERGGYLFVNTPHITKATLFETSGHLGWFREHMYPPMELEGAQYYVKPMNCPFHILIYRSRGRSYRELPMRLFEFGTVYRYEKSGVVHGLTRVRGLTMDDAHIFCTREQMTGELKSLLRFVLDLLRDFGLTDFYLELSTKPLEKAAGSDEDWAEATEALRLAAAEEGLALTLDEGGGAFYGPKISVQARDAIGRAWQMSTIQLDFQLPRRFELEYQAADNSRQQPVMIHRALFGSVERFFGILTEHYAGAFPPWLAPVQVTCIPVASRHADYLHRLADRLAAAGIRVEVDDSDERMQKKIVKAQQAKVPFMLIAGDRDLAADAVSFRYRSGHERRGVPVQEALDEIVAAVANRAAEPGPADLADGDRAR